MNANMLNRGQQFDLIILGAMLFFKILTYCECETDQGMAGGSRSPRTKYLRK